MEVRQEVIHCLSKDARPVDRVYCPKVMLCVEGLSVNKDFTISFKFIIITLTK